MRLALLAALAAFALLATGCHGPKGSPTATVESYWAAVDSEDWDALVETLSADGRAKLGSNGPRYFESQYGGWKSIDVDIDDWSMNADQQSATVRFTCRAEMKKGYKYVPLNCSDNFAVVKESDGKWHVVVAGGKNLQAM